MHLRNQPEEIPPRQPDRPAPGPHLHLDQPGALPPVSILRRPLDTSRAPSPALLATLTPVTARPVSSRPQPRPLVTGSPYDIASRQDPNSTRFSPAYAHTLQAAVSINVPLSRESRRAMELDGGLLIKDILQRTEANVEDYSSTRVAAPDSSPTPYRTSDGPEAIAAPVRAPVDNVTSVMESSAKNAPKKKTSRTKATTQAKAPTVTKPQSNATEDQAQAKKEKTKIANRERQRAKRERDREEEAKESMTVVSLDKDGKPKAPPLPDFERDYGTEGEAGGSARDVVVSFMAKEGYISKHKISDAVAKRKLAEPIQAELRERGMADRPLSSIVTKVGDILRRVTVIADKLRTQTGFGLDVEDGQTMNDWLKAQPDGPMYLQLESIVRDMHSVNPLLIHDSGSTDSLTTREDLLGLLVKPQIHPELDEEDLSETEKEDNGDDSRQESQASAASKQIINIADNAADFKGKNVPGRKTGPISRPKKSSADTTNASAWTANNDRKGKGPQEIGKLVTSRLDAHLDHVRERSQKQDEHLAWKQRRAEEQLEIERRKDSREQQAHDAARVHQERLNQITLADHYTRLVLKDKHDEEIAGEIVFGPTAWRNLRGQMIALVNRRQKRKRTSEGDDSEQDTPERKRHRGDTPESPFGVNCTVIDL